MKHSSTHSTNTQTNTGGKRKGKEKNEQKEKIEFLKNQIEELKNVKYKIKLKRKKKNLNLIQKKKIRKVLTRDDDETDFFCVN